MPAAFSSGAVSSKMRPLDRAIVIMAMTGQLGKNRILQQKQIISRNEGKPQANPEIGPDPIRISWRLGVLAANLRFSTHAPDARAKAGELLFDPFVAAIEVVDTVDGGSAARDEAGKHQARGSAQIGCHHRRAVEMTDTFYHRGIALDLDVRAEALQLLHVHEAVLEDGLGDDRGAARDAVQRHELSLHVGGK